MPHFVYMLRCKGNRIYTGYAVDVEARFEHHRSGKGAKFTRAFPPECILRTFELNSKEEALRLEARIKKLPREKKALLAAGSAGTVTNQEGADNAATEVSAAAASTATIALEKSLLEGLVETLTDQKKRTRRESHRGIRCKIHRGSRSVAHDEKKSVDDQVDDQVGGQG